LVVGAFNLGLVKLLLNRQVSDCGELILAKLRKLRRPEHGFVAHEDRRFTSV